MNNCYGTNPRCKLLCCAQSSASWITDSKVGVQNTNKLRINYDGCFFSRIWVPKRQKLIKKKRIWVSMWLYQHSYLITQVDTKYEVYECQCHYFYLFLQISIISTYIIQTNLFSMTWGLTILNNFKWVTLDSEKMGCLKVVSKGYDWKPHTVSSTNNRILCSVVI